MGAHLGYTMIRGCARASQRSLRMLRPAVAVRATLTTPPLVGRSASGIARLDPTNLAEFEHNTKHILTALVTNEPGTLAHIAGTMTARGYNIDSLVVGRTEIPELSRVTIVVYGSEQVMTQVQTQLED